MMTVLVDSCLRMYFDIEAKVNNWMKMTFRLMMNIGRIKRPIHQVPVRLWTVKYWLYQNWTDTERLPPD